MKRMAKARIIFYKAHRILKYRNMPLKNKLFISSGILILSMIILSAVTFINYKLDKESSTIDIIRQMNSQTITKLDDYMNDLGVASKFPLLSDNSIGNGSSLLLNELESFSDTNIDTLDFQKSVNVLAHKIFNFKTTIHSVFVFNLSGKNEYSIRGGSMYKEYNPSDEEWFRQAVEGFGKTIQISTFAMPYVSDIHDKKVYVFSLARGLYKLDSSKTVGVILVNSKIDYLSDLCKKMKFIPNQRIVITDKNGYIIYDTVESNITKEIAPIFSDLSVNATEGSKELQYDGKDYLVNFTTSELTNWKIINIVPKLSLDYNIYRIRNATMLITTVLVFMSFFMSLIISSQIAKPVKKLIQQMKLVEKGNFDAKIKYVNNDELGQLARTFNGMTLKVKKLINEVYIDKIKQKELELQMLQSQINPHFLYNTLESINMLAEIEDVPNISEMVTALGKILRYGISNKDELVTIREEIEYLQYYILLQKVRFEDIFSISVNVDESIYNNKIIKLILQPLVENAIYHGLYNKSSNGRIDITAYKNDSNIIFEVTDNGGGMDNDQVKKINDYINDLDSSFKSIGLKNVNKRIKLYSGNEYGITIESTLNVGTNVIVIVPCK